MNLSDQVTPLDLSKRLRELGVKQNSYFKLYISDKSGYAFTVSPNSVIDSQDKYSSIYSAFTASELLELLPASIPTGAYSKGLEILKTNNFKVGYIDHTWGFGDIQFSDENLCKALAKMLIHLITSKLIEV